MLREATAVLLGILVAFGIDAWWSGHNDRVDLEGQLDAVRVELDAALEEVERTLLPVYLGQMERFLRLTPEEVVRMPPDEAQRAIRQTGIWTFDANLSTIRALASSTLLAERAPQLVAPLGLVPQLVDDLSEDAARVELWRHRCIGRLTELGLYGSMWMIWREAGVPEKTPREILTAQMEDPEYHSCIAALNDQRRDYSGEVEAIREALLDARARIDPDA